MLKKHHVTTLIVCHYHLQVHHQVMTHGAIRQASYWLVNGNQVVSNELTLCVTCKRLRGRPQDKTRGLAATSKRWGLFFTSLNSRAVHIEVLESMDSSSFICALRRFFALRGPVSLTEAPIL